MRPMIQYFDALPKPALLRNEWGAAVSTYYVYTIAAVI
jgi:hypothetical protein